jgi:hypothetical protein
VNDRATRWRAFAAIGALLLSSLLGGCGEVASPDTTPEGGSPAQPSIEEVLAAIQAATPNPVTPEAVAETFALGTNATDIQREMMKQDLVGSVVEWNLVVYDVKLLDGGQYQVTSQPVQIPSPAPLQHVAVVVLIQSQGPEDDAFLRRVQTDDPIRIRGLVQDVFLRSIVRIGPGVVVGAAASTAGA